MKEAGIYIGTVFFASKREAEAAPGSGFRSGFHVEEGQSLSNSLPEFYTISDSQHTGAS